MDPLDCRDTLGELGLAAVIRTPDSNEALTISRSLLREGVRAIEITFTVPDAADVIAELRSEVGAIIGAGTVTTRAQFEAAVAAGADFVVSPVHPPFLLPAAAEAGVLAVPGCATPHEIWTALDAGALAVKVFPAARLGGPAYLRDIMSPLSSPHIMASGGIGIDDLAEYRRAGTWCVALGSNLSGSIPEAERSDRAQRAVATAAA